jgi:hypothetical protein
MIGTVVAGIKGMSLGIAAAPIIIPYAAAVVTTAAAAAAAVAVAGVVRYLSMKEETTLVEQTALVAESTVGGKIFKKISEIY